MEDIINKKKSVSFSQYSWFRKCQYKWYLDQVLGLKQFEDSINTCFGTAIHDVVQLYIKTLYTETVDKADSIELFKLFKEKFNINLKEKNIKYEDDEYTDFIFDGEDLINEFLKTSNRMKHFPSQKYEFIGVEFKVEMPIKNNINLIAYLDLVLREKKTGSIKIIDFKTSTNGWNSYMRDNYLKHAQLLLYKAIYSKKFNVPLNNINVEFFILKRKLYEGVNYPQSRIQIFSPPNKKQDVVSTINDFIEFLDNCFTPTGEYKNDISLYPKTPGDRKKNCEYCPFKKVICNQKPDVPDELIKGLIPNELIKKSIKH